MVMAASGLRNLSFRSKLPFNQSIRMFLYKCFSPTYPLFHIKTWKNCFKPENGFLGTWSRHSHQIGHCYICQKLFLLFRKSLIIIFSAEVHGQKVNAPPPPWHICVYAPKINPLKRMCVESSCPLWESHVINI